MNASLTIKYRFSKSITIHGSFALVFRQLDRSLDLSPSTATSLEVPPHPEFGAICTGFPSAKLGASVVQTYSTVTNLMKLVCDDGCSGLFASSSNFGCCTSMSVILIMYVSWLDHRPLLHGLLSPRTATLELTAYTFCIVCIHCFRFHYVTNVNHCIVPKALIVP